MLDLQAFLSIISTIASLPRWLLSSWISLLILAKAHFGRSFPVSTWFTFIFLLPAGLRPEQENVPFQMRLEPKGGQNHHPYDRKNFLWGCRISLSGPLMRSRESAKPTPCTCSQAKYVHISAVVGYLGRWKTQETLCSGGCPPSTTCSTSKESRMLYFNTVCTGVTATSTHG